jgi:hypothetical protein
LQPSGPLAFLAINAPQRAAAKVEAGAVPSDSCSMCPWVREKKLPRPFKLVAGGRLVGWYESDLAAFEAQRRAA